MRLKSYLFICFIIFCGQSSWSQKNTSISLKEVVIATNHNSSLKVNQQQKFNDSIINQHQPILSDLLKNNTLLYFKEYGQGMLSTVSFRGTTASQTAVLWNGININSQLNGSTDFNTISLNGIQNVEVKAGGGSVLYGSGAIGGTVHLNNQLVYGGKNRYEIGLSAGSFDTYSGKFSASFPGVKTSFNVGFSHFQSYNKYAYKDKYDWQGKQRYNLNAQYQLSEINLSFGHKISPKSNIRLFSQSAFNDRNLALTTESDPHAKYIINYSRNLLDYSLTTGKFVINPKIAYLSERYQYFPELEKKDQFSFGEANTFLGRLNLNYQFKKTKIYSVSEWNSTHGFGGSFGDNRRQTISESISFQQNIFRNWLIEGGLRKEITANFESPLLFSLGSVLTLKKFALKASGSKNFRIPTFNDLYWDGQGNPDLKPETAIQGELSQEVQFKFFKVGLTEFYNDITQMIRWIPTTSDVWRPMNVDKVKVYGGELFANATIKWNNEHLIDLKTGLSYTASVNQETNKQLFYTPYYRSFINVSYWYKSLAVFVQNNYTGKVYTTSDNNEEYIIKPYWLTNSGIEYGFYKRKVYLKAIVNNLLDAKYTSIDKPMPGRNYNFQITFKF